MAIGIQVRASHILVPDLEKAQAIRQQLAEGADFAELARSNSRCPSSRNGGDLGSFGPGMMVKTFEDASFALPLDQVSDPVQTQFGWHIIKRTA